MDPTFNELIRWAFQQGALTLVIILGALFWYYNSKRQSEAKDATITTLIALVNQVNTTQATQSAAIREQAVATAQLSDTLHELKDELRAMMRLSPMRRGGGQSS